MPLKIYPRNRMGNMVDALGYGTFASGGRQEHEVNVTEVKK